MDGAEFVPEPDPFGSFASLFDLDPLDLGGEGPRSGIARRDRGGALGRRGPGCRCHDGPWPHAPGGRPRGRGAVGPKIVDRRPEQLRPGDVLLVGRRARARGSPRGAGGAAGPPSRPPRRPAAHRSVPPSCSATRFAELRPDHRGAAPAHGRRWDATRPRLPSRSWVTEGGIMAPRDLVDLQRLNTALDLGMSDVQMDELFAGVQRRRHSAAQPGGRWPERHAARPPSMTPSGSTRRRASPSRTSATPSSKPRSSPCEPCDALVPLTLIGRLEES